jgi:hypothetical protein
LCPAIGGTEEAMQETPQQYTQRILSFSNGKDPIAIQKDNGQ